MPIPSDIHSIPDVVDKAAARSPDSVALRDNSNGVFHSWSYTQLSDTMYRVARFLHQNGVAFDDTVGILLPNCRWWGAAFLGVLACDAIAVPLDSRLQQAELAEIFLSARLTALIVSPLFAKSVEQLQAAGVSCDTVLWLNTDPRSDAPSPALDSCSNLPLHRKKFRSANACLIYTSGTTGNPKGVVLTHANLLSNAYDLVAYLEVDSSQHFVSILPLNHVFEITGGFLAPLILRASVTYAGSLRPDVILHTIRNSDTTVMMVVPVFLRLFLTTLRAQCRQKGGVIFFALFAFSRFALSCRIPIGKLLFRSLKSHLNPCFRAFVCGGAPLEASVVRDFAALGLTVLQGYGLSETSPVICVNSFRFNRIGSVGKPLPTLEVRIAGPDGLPARQGELLVRGNAVFNGYYHNPRATDAVFHNHWFRTGDIARILPGGYISIRGRAKDTIITDGGKNIYPDEIEAVLLRSPLVADACVVGLRDHRAGERPVAVITVVHGYRSDNQQNLYQQLRPLLHSIAEYKRPRKMYLWDSLPKTAALKTKRSEVAARLVQDCQHGLIHG